MDLEELDYDQLAGSFSQALIETLRKHSIADGILDFWVPDSDPVASIVGMIDSARLAGLEDVRVRVSMATLPQELWGQLEQAVGEVATEFALSAGNDGVVIAARGLHEPGADTSEPSREDRSRQVDERGGDFDVAAAPMIPVHDRLRPGLAKAFLSLAHEGTSSNLAGGDVDLSETKDGTTLTLYLNAETDIVVHARHAGGGTEEERAALDLFCKAAEGLPIQEVADHTGLFVIAALVEDAEQPVPGILLPANAGSVFQKAPALARAIFNGYSQRAGKKVGTNFYYAPPSAEWQGLAELDQVERVTKVVKAFLQSEGLYPDDMQLLRLEKNRYGYAVRVVVSFSDRVPVDRKPALMRHLERRIRRDLDATIELIADRAKDMSPLRRLS